MILNNQSQSFSNKSSDYSIAIEEILAYKNDLHQQRKLSQRKIQEVFKLKQKVLKLEQQVKNLTRKVKNYQANEQIVKNLFNLKTIFQQQMSKVDQCDLTEHAKLVNNIQDLKNENEKFRDQINSLNQIIDIKNIQIKKLNTQKQIFLKNMTNTQQQLSKVKLTLINCNQKLQKYEIKMSTISNSLPIDPDFAYDNYCNLLNNFVQQNYTLKKQNQNKQKLLDRQQKQRNQIKQLNNKLQNIQNELKRQKKDYQTVYNLYEMKSHQYQRLKLNYQNDLSQRVTKEITEVIHQYRTSQARKNTVIQNLMNLLTLKQGVKVQEQEKVIQQAKMESNRQNQC